MENNKGTKSVDTIRFLHHSGASPFGGWRHHLCPGGKRVTGFSVACGSLRIQFPCHPANGGTMGAGYYSQLVIMTVEERKPYNRAFGP